MMFLDCLAYLDHDGAVRCGLPAEVERQFTMSSSDGPADSAKIRCPAGHWFNGAIESLTWESRDKHDPGSAGVASPPSPGGTLPARTALLPTIRGGPSTCGSPPCAPAAAVPHPTHVMETVTGCRERTPSDTASSQRRDRNRLGVTTIASSPVITAQTR